MIWTMSVLPIGRPIPLKATRRYLRSVRHLYKTLPLEGGPNDELVLQASNMTRYAVQPRHVCLKSGSNTNCELGSPACDAVAHETDLFTNGCAERHFQAVRVDVNL